MLDCLDCLTYDADGNLAALVDPDGPIECKPDGSLGLKPSSEIKPKVYNDELLLEAPTDNNGLAVVGGQLVLDQRPLAAYAHGSASGIPKSTGTNQPFGTTATIPANPGCHPAIATITSTVRHKGNAPADSDQYLFQPLAVGGPLFESWRRRFAVPFQFDESHTHVLQTVRPPNAGPLTVPLTYESRSQSPSFLERWSVCWQAVTLSIKACQ